MNPRQRFEAILAHQPTDTLCVDMGAGAQTGIGLCALHRLRQAVLGEKDYRVKVIEPYQMLGEVDEALRQVLKLDVAGIPAPSTMFGCRNEGWKPFTMHDGTPCLVPENFNWTRDEDGGFLTYPEGDTSAAPCAKMPKASYFFDALDRQQPIAEEHLDPADNCEEFGLLEERDIKYFAEEARRLHEETDYGIYMTLPGTGFGDIALVPAPWIKNPRGIRGVEEWYLSLLIRPGYVRKIFEAQCEYALRNIERLADAIGNRVQAVFVSGTDFGTQRSQFCSVQTYRDLFKPFHKAVNDKIHALTNWKTFIHSCGAVYPLIPEFIDAGFDILNPVQCSAADMAPKRLKAEFGSDVVFWGGGVDTQLTLPLGTPEEVYRQVRERIDIFFEDSTGFVFNTVHNIQSNVPVENIQAMFRAVNDARGIQI